MVEERLTGLPCWKAGDGAVVRIGFPPASAARWASSLPSSTSLRSPSPWPVRTPALIGFRYVAAVRWPGAMPVGGRVAAFGPPVRVAGAGAWLGTRRRHTTARSGARRGSASATVAVVGGSRLGTLPRPVHAPELAGWRPATRPPAAICGRPNADPHRIGRPERSPMGRVARRPLEGDAFHRL
jgi:hypothetical protein